MRSLVLLVVVGFAFSLVVPTVRSFLAQRAEVSALEREVAAARTQNAELAAELERWKDPAYVGAQARDRLAYVLPGEVAYRVVDPETVTVAPEVSEPVEPQTPSSGILTPASDVPWFESIWESVKVAGTSDTTSAPADDGVPVSEGDEAAVSDDGAPASEGEDASVSTDDGGSSVSDASPGADS